MTLKQVLTRVFLLRDSREKYIARLRECDDVHPQTVECSRCHKKVDSEFDPHYTMTAGYYHVCGEPEDNFWAKFKNPGEEFLCDNCMWSEPRFIAVYGNVCPHATKQS